MHLTLASCLWVEENIWHNINIAKCSLTEGRKIALRLGEGSCPFSLQEMAYC